MQEICANHPVMARSLGYRRLFRPYAHHYPWCGFDPGNYLTATELVLYLPHRLHAQLRGKKPEPTAIGGVKLRQLQPLRYKMPHATVTGVLARTSRDGQSGPTV